MAGYLNNEICNQRLPDPCSLFCDTRTNYALGIHNGIIDHNAMTNITFHRMILDEDSFTCNTDLQLTNLLTYPANLCGFLLHKWQIISDF